MESFIFSVLTIYSCTYVLLWPECMKIRSPISTPRHLSPVSPILFITLMNRSSRCSQRGGSFLVQWLFANMWSFLLRWAVTFSSCQGSLQLRMKQETKISTLKSETDFLRQMTFKCYLLRRSCRCKWRGSGFLRFCGGGEWNRRLTGGLVHRLQWCERCWITWESNPIRSQI